MKTNILSVIITLALVCFGVLPKAQAVNPAPDGGYPNFTTAEGQNALFSLTTGAANTAVGWYSLFSNVTGSFNTTSGAGALLFNTGDANTAVGAAALLNNTTGAQNTAVGAAALLNNTGGSFNTAIGDAALVNNTTGIYNVALGDSALAGNMNGSGNIALGVSAGSNITAANGVICIGLSGVDVSNSCFIANIRGTTTHFADTLPVLIDSNGQLGTASSSRRFKKEIQAMNKASEAILKLKPVTFHYKNDKTDTPQFGLIAEEVAEVNPGLVVRDEKGDIYTVRYDAVNAMLLNEFLKEHHQVQDLKAIVLEQQSQIKALAAGLQKVTAHVETSHSAPQVVRSSH